MRIVQEEIFGPVVAVLPFDSEDDAVRIGNDTTFGLGSGIWTRDVKDARAALTIAKNRPKIGPFRRQVFHGEFRCSNLGPAD
jgi:(Z)-2-((N-methylformamido)methylene)-5-hydroxybutyrolactone dehydrogenase